MTMNILHDVPLGSDAPEKFNVIIEIPKGSSNKYEIDKETGLMKLDRVLYSAMFSPMDYGFAPQTHWHDGDPLDVLVMTTYNLLPGVLVEVRPIAVIRMIDSGDRDEKIIAVPTGDPRFNGMKDVSDIEEHILFELKHYYEHYKDLQKKKVEVTGIEGVKEAKEVVIEGMKMYKEKFKK
ncbi:inorganic diphosphatase [Candidatus Azambacteria bacterium]|nr:inorganic diphosphatase [Candidatus Azambacteria bacterium]